MTATLYHCVLRRWSKCSLGSIAAFVIAGCGSSPHRVVVVSCAASLSDVMTEIAHEYERENPGTSVRLNIGSSGELLRQIEASAPVDVFVSAGKKEMDRLASKGKLEPSSRFEMARNRLVLLARPDAGIRSWADLKPETRLAIGDPETVPAGRYAKQTLERRGKWKLLSPRLVLGQNVRQTLTYFVHGDVDAAIVFQTDAMAAKPPIRPVGTAVDGQDHEPIVYPAAAIQGHGATAAPFLRVLASRATSERLRRYGFVVQGGR